jgi:GNAT superfamily N-acetyltransferase
MATIDYRAISDVDFDAFTTAFNRAYSDYFMPIVMTAPAFRALIERDDLDLSQSVAALDGDTIIGTGLLGVRDRLGWIGGMGVIPERRRQGIGRHMMHYLLARARDMDLAHVDLEVLEANEGAYALYRELGFQDRRYLLTFDRVPAAISAEPLPRFEIEQRATSAVLEHFTAFHDIPNCWQRALPSLDALAPYVHSWAALDNGSIVGYAMGWANEHSVRLIDFATNPQSDRAAVAYALLAHLHQQNPRAHGNSYNIADDDPVLPAFTRLGYIPSFRQIEMRIAVGSH